MRFLAVLILGWVPTCAGQVFNAVPVTPPGTNVVSGAVLHGIVTGEDGSIITGGAVSAVRIPDAFVSRLGRKTASAAIQADGTFQFPGLVAGAYRICTQATGQWINPCEWGLNGPTVPVSAQPSPSLALVLKKAALVTVRVEDPTQLLAANEGVMPGAHLLIGVNTDANFFRPATVASRDASGRNYQILIPFGRALKIVTASAYFQLSDALGKPLPLFGNSIPVLVPSGQLPPVVLLRVTGKVNP